MSGRCLIQLFFKLQQNIFVVATLANYHAYIAKAILLNYVDYNPDLFNRYAYRL